MAEPMTTMFGKAYDTVGSADRNLVLQTRGDLKVKWGNKYIDLIKNGKINVDVDLLKKVSSLEDIIKDGIYLIEDEKTKEVWVAVGDSKINILGEVTNNYVAFIKELDVDAENKLRALSNIGFFYKTLEDAKKALLTQGIFFLLDQNKLYFVENGEYKEYIYTPTLEIPNPLVVGSITLNGTSSEISVPQELGINVENNRYISITNNKISVDREITTSNAISSDNFVSNSKGFSIYYDNNNYIGEFDVIKIRKALIYDEILDVTYDELKLLISGNKLYPNKKYRITDFFNEWDYYKYTINGTNNVLYYFPIVVTAKSNNELKSKGYLCDREDWVIEYDISFNYLIDEILDLNNYVEIYTRGRITRLTDEFGNSANYDFKHRLFKYNASDDRKNWYYTYNITRTINPTSSKDVNNWEYIHSNWDASLDGNIVNNNINLPLPTTESYTLHSGKTVQKIVQNDNYILFPNCSTIYPHDNTILSSQGKYVITGNFYGNTFLGLYDNSGQDVQFTLDFHDNTFLKVQNCVLNAPMQYNTFDRNLVNVSFQCTSMSNNHITGIIYTNNARDSYPVLVANFNNNIINNINMSAINCSGCDIANNIINNINGCAITNSTLTDITMKDITGDGLYEMNPTDNIDDSLITPVNPGGNTPGGGDTPVDPGGDTPVNPGDVTPPSTSPNSDNTDNKYTVTGAGYHNNTSDAVNANGVSSTPVGKITNIDSSLSGVTPTVWAVYDIEGSNIINKSNVTLKASGNEYIIKATINSNSTNSTRKARIFVTFDGGNHYGYVNVYQAASSGGSTPTTTDADVDEYLNTFKSSSLSSTSLSNEKYSLLSTAMDKLDTFESSVMSDSMFIDDVYTLPSGNSSDTRDARRGWFMGLLLTALYPMIGSTTVNNAILTDAMSNWGISQSTNTNTYSVSTYEAKYKGLLQGSIAFSWLFSDSSFVNSFAPFASYTYQGSDGDLGAGSTVGYYHAPQGQYFFPYPPTNNINATSGLMKRDEDAFNDGKSLRDNNSSRAILATTNKDLNDNPIGDVNTSLKYYIRILNAATGKTYSETPSKGSLLYDTHWNGNRTVNLIKNTSSFWRSRPAWENNDTSVDSDTYDLNFGTASGKSGSTSNTTSYPSGHTGYLWNTAYCFMAVGGLSNSAVVNLFKRAYQYSESRVIAGAHWQMCVEMGRIAAACSFATLCGNTKFIQELLAAQG